MVWTRNRPLGLTHHEPRRAEPGYTLFASVRGAHATLVDMEGRIVHRWRHEEGIQYAHMLPSGNLLVRSMPPADAEGTERIGGSTGSLFELDWDGNEVWRYDNPLMHHACRRLPGGSTLICLWRQLPEGMTARVLGGSPHEEDPERMWADVVQEIAPDGEVLWEWRAWEHMDVEQHVKCPLENRREWTHLNSIALTPAGDLLLSFRLTDTIAVVDRKTGAFKWTWGPGVLSHQHHATWLSGDGLDDGRILLFDNGCHRRHGPAYSRVVEVDTGSGEIAWEYRDPTVLAFSSFMVSGCERLPGGNTFITEGATGRLFEVTPEGDIVWEYVSPFMMESAFGPTPAIFRAHRYPPDDPRLSARDLSPEPYAELTAQIARNEFPEEPRPQVLLDREREQEEREREEAKQQESEREAAMRRETSS